jgi:hypothetical protein
VLTGNDIYQGAWENEMRKVRRGIGGGDARGAEAARESRKGSGARSARSGTLPLAMLKAKIHRSPLRLVAERTRPSPAASRGHKTQKTAVGTFRCARRRTGACVTATNSNTERFEPSSRPRLSATPAASALAELMTTQQLEELERKVVEQQAKASESWDE